MSAGPTDLSICFWTSRVSRNGRRRLLQRPLTLNRFGVPFVVVLPTLAYRLSLSWRALGSPTRDGAQVSIEHQQDASGSRTQAFADIDAKRHPFLRQTAVICGLHSRGTENHHHQKRSHCACIGVWESDAPLASRLQVGD
jgi:hypothetical protein